MAAGDVLDDIQDDDLTVSGWESVSIAAETLAALLVLAHSALALAAENDGGDQGYVRALSKLTTFEAEALHGQSIDVRSTSGSTTHVDALKITRAKSGALGRCAAELGASVASSDEHLVRLHGDFGEHIAVVFQLMNDIAGIWPGEETHSDVANKRPTPLLHYLSTVGQASATTRQATNNSDHVAPPANLAQSGAVQFTWALASTELARARTKAHEIETRHPSSRLSFLLRR